ncbi:MAG: HAD family hydrolase [Nitrospirae bacterium GWC2_56_14]|nr:MAG: HAD family hydrolase [Nitrospirae bacterium GWC2_56_14]
MLTAVIFDFDGVIVDTEPLHYRAFQEVLKPLGMGYTWDVYLATYIGFDDRDAFRAAFASVGQTINPEHLGDLIELKAQAFNRIISSGVEPYPGVVNLILSVKKVVPVALCSGALRCDIDPILEQLSLSGTFDVIVTADDVPISKPDPASYLLTVQRLSEKFPAAGMIPSSILAVEDTPAGIASAKGAGLRVLAVTNSYPADKLGNASSIASSLENFDFQRLCQV